ncbi:deubiquitinase OTUD6B [Plodia interpunctella]|uniref:deubiquitinase OTUD6B n=1 Tax=Plodia interpunctella TaxID=58824 RepID=UPI0023685B82|nr:deubiquitinase OTUD6B [Plodia interpunctella]
MEANDLISSIEARHRKEKKELQAQIQALKKAAKNDKTKKKELLAEIARLEVEQDSRHREELKVALEQHNGNVGDGFESTLQSDDVSSEATKVRVSKAQKRRDKKIQLEKEREEQIKQQEKENIHGPRNTENEAINAKLKQRNLKIYSIPSDGDCLYKAVAHQLLLKRQEIISVDVLRNKVADYINNNKNEFLPFMTNTETLEILTNEEFEDYCDKIRNTKVWGGQLEIRALSSSLKCPIIIIQATGPETIEQGSEFVGDPLTLTYHRHMYKLGEHYNSTCLNEHEDVEDD